MARRKTLYQHAPHAMLRAAARIEPVKLAPWLDSDATTADWRSWLEYTWGDDEFARAVATASPDLARQVQDVLDGTIDSAKRIRRAALSVGKYALRFTGRSVPFGFFAGVAPAAFGSAAEARFGTRHLLAARHGPTVLKQAIDAAHTDPETMSSIQVVVNNLAYISNGRLFVPEEGADENALAVTPVLALVLSVAAEPILHSELLDKIAAEYPTAPRERVAAAVGELLRVGALVSELRAPATVVDPAEVLDVCARPAGTPMAVDLLLDAQVTLPQAVGVEFETAATLLARMPVYPAGTPAWREYTQRFADRYGEGVPVDLRVLTNPGSGLGFPDGFGALSMPPRPMSLRDRVLLEIAGTAAIEGARAVDLTGALIERIEHAAGEAALRQAPHLEICGEIQSESIVALDRGDFRLRVHTASRAAGAYAARMWHLFGDDPAPGFADLPTVEPGARTAQMSFHPARCVADLLTRAPQILPTVLSVGEFRHRGPDVLLPDDLAVLFDGERLVLTVATTGEYLEPLATTAINFIWENYTPPLARFLAEISRASCPQVTGFDWGAALVLPFTPALHHRRTILIPARWRVQARDLPGSSVTLHEWARELHLWRSRHRMPTFVRLTDGDQHLPLDLEDGMHLEILRRHLRVRSTATMFEAPPDGAADWLGGRAHSIVVSMAAR